MNKEYLIKLCNNNDIYYVFKSDDSFSLSNEAFFFLTTQDVTIYRIDGVSNLTCRSIINLNDICKYYECPYYLYCNEKSYKYNINLFNEVVYNMSLFHEDVNNFLENWNED